MTLRERFTADLKTAMLAKDAPRVSAIRMITAKLKDTDIAARPKGVTAIADDEIIAMLKGMVKSRKESVELYTKGGRQDLVDKEQAEIDVIETFLPAQMDDAATEAAVDAAIAESGAASMKEMGKVMAILKAKHAASLDMSKVNPLVKQKLGG
ncbi:MAG: GatB/YqeY domain-containing protein [Acetobacteraceae bacterium]|nr:GatB/YqeY domain-containing protein [Acetobacteraceae bacterium]